MEENQVSKSTEKDKLETSSIGTNFSSEIISFTQTIVMLSILSFARSAGE